MGRGRPRTSRLVATWAVAAACALVASACGGGTEGAGGDAGASDATGTGDPATAQPGTIRLYSSVTEDTIRAVVDAFAEASPDVDVEVFRAATGELNARIAAEERERGLEADLLWLTDPLSMQQYSSDGLLEVWEPAEAGVVPVGLRTDDFIGTRILNLVIVQQEGLEPPVASWADLTDPSLADAVALPDPAFAGSAFAALAYFGSADEYGFDYYRALKDNGAVQVQAPDDVINGVAEGQYEAGITLDKSVRDAAAEGSPIELIWPEPGAIAIYSPIAVVDGSAGAAAAKGFVDFVLSPDGQAAIASTGWQPVRGGVEWTEQTEPVVEVDWSAAFDTQQDLLDRYRSIFGG